GRGRRHAARRAAGHPRGDAAADPGACRGRRPGRRAGGAGAPGAARERLAPGLERRADRARRAHLRGGLGRLRRGVHGTTRRAGLVDASSRLERLRLDEQRRAGLAIEMFDCALEWLNTAGSVVTGRVLGHRLREREVRLGLERAYRMLAALEPDPLARYRLVDE